jgi:Tfp pilus assembly protein PilO
VGDTYNYEILMRTNTLIAATSTICGIALFLLGAWAFIAYKSFSYKSQIATISEEIRSKSSEDSYLISLRSTLREAKDEAETIERRFISEENVPAFITMLEEKAASFGVKVDFSGINVKKSEEEALLEGVLALQMTGSGTWSAVTAFIVSLDSLPYATTIEEIRVSNPTVASETAEPAADWKFNVSLKQYLGKKI